MALEHVAQGQTRFFTPGVAPDPRGILLGRSCLMTFPTLEGAVTPNAKVSWSAEEDPERAGFEILWRETTEARWEVYEFVATGMESVLKGVSTDNHFFAVRAVGKNGARSIAVPTEMDTNRRGSYSRRSAPLHLDCASFVATRTGNGH